MWLANRADADVIDAHMKRFEFSEAAGLLRTSSVTLSRQARSYIATGRDINRNLYFDELDRARMQNFYDVFRDDGLSQEEERLLLLVLENFNMFRDFELRSLAAKDAELHDYAWDLIFGPAVRVYATAFEANLDQIIYISDTRLFEHIAQTEFFADISRTAAQIAVIIFAFVSAGGMLYLLREVRGHMQREKEARQLSDILLEHAPYIMSLRSEDGSPISVKEYAVQLLGLPDKEFYISNFWATCPELQACGTPSPQKVEQMVKQAFETGYVCFEWMHKTLNDKPVPMEVKVVPFQKDGQNVLITYGTDLSQVKAQQKEAEEIQEMNEIFLSNAPFVINVFTSELEFVSSNQRAVEMFGVNSPSEVGPRFLEITPPLQFCGTPTLEKMRNQAKIALETGYCKDEWLFQSLSGELIPCEANIVRFKQRDQLYLAAYITDLRQARAIMQQEQAMADVMQANQAKTSFLARMSHEIRTPLSAIMGITEIQLQTSRHTPEAEEAFTRIANSSSMLLTIINDILDLTKIEVGKMEIIEEPYELASMVVDAVQLNLMYTGSKGLEFELKVDENLPSYLVGDELRIKQILNNILSNAFKYTEKGEITFSLSMEPCLNTNEIVLLLSIADTGVGMTNEQVENIFEEYTRAQNEQTRLIAGTGLGMSIASQLVELMNGSTQVESEVDKGTTVLVRIPQKVKDPQPLGLEVAQNLEKMKDNYAMLNRKKQKLQHEPMPYGRVLIVDDVESNLYVARGLMIPYDLSIETVLSGQEAIDRVAAGEVYDIIFMDHMMPHMNGVEAIKILFSMGYNKPIVALTANAVKGQADIFLNFGFDAFIPKPINVNTLDDCLMQFIKNRQPQDVIDAARAAKLAQAENAATSKGYLSSELVNAFLKDAQWVISTLTPIVNSDTALEGDALKTYITHVHAIKSALANIGQTDASNSAYELEEDARSGNLAGIKRKTAQFIGVLKNIANNLQPIETKIEAYDDLGFLWAQLTALGIACADYDVKAANAVMGQLGSRPLSAAAQNVLNELSSKLLYGDFEEVAELAKKHAQDIKGGQTVWNKSFLW